MRVASEGQSKSLHNKAKKKRLEIQKRQDKQELYHGLK